VDVTHTGIRNVPVAGPVSFDFSGGVERRLEVMGGFAETGSGEIGHGEAS